MSVFDSTTMYSAPLEPQWPETKRHVPWYDGTATPAPSMIPQLPVTQHGTGMPDQCRARLSSLRSERAAIEARIPVLDAEIEALEKMLAAIGVTT